MDNGLWTTWYDLADAGRDAYLDWLHGEHLPEIMRWPGIAWAAHYQITGGGTKMQAIHDRLVHVEDEDVGTGVYALHALSGCHSRM